MELILKGDSIQTIADLHEQLKDLLGLPEYYGMNLDALSDCLTGWIEPPVTIIWKNFSASKANLGDYAESALGVFKDAQDEVNGFKIVCG